MNLLALNPIAFNLGPVQIHWYGIFIASAVLLAIYLSTNEAGRRGIDPDNIYNLILWALPVAIVSARIYYVVFQWNYYREHLNEIVRVWDGGIAIYGALIGSGIVIYYFCREHRLSIWRLLDVIAPTVIMGQAIGRWGNFMNQEAFGWITSLRFLRALRLPRFVINQMLINGFYRQPTFLYESLWDALGFVLLMTLRHVPHLFKNGEVFLSYVLWYSFCRFFTEGMRTDSLMLGNVRVSQWLSIFLFLSAAGLIAWRRFHQVGWYVSARRSS